MIFFQQIETPEFCYIAEAALWLALGRVPPSWREEVNDPVTGNLQYVDFRRGEEAMLKGTCRNYASAFHEEEFKAIGLEVDYDRYLDVREKTRGLSAGDNLDSLRTDFELKGLEASRDPAGMKSAASEYTHLARWVHDLEAEFDGVVDEARAKVFQALVSGELEAEGWKPASHGTGDPESGAYHDPDPQGRFYPVSKSLWDRRGFDWDESVLSGDGGMFRAVQVRFDDVLACFPVPSARGHEMNGQMFGATLIIDPAAAGDTGLPSTRKGRPARISPEMQRAIKNYFSHRIRQGSAPQDREALYAEVVEFVKVTLGVTISHTAAQGYVKGLVDGMP